MLYNHSSTEKEQFKETDKMMGLKLQLNQVALLGSHA